MFNFLIVTVIVAVLIIAVLASRKPDEFRVTRSRRIVAPASAIFEQINSIPKTQEWSPWVRMDPHAVYNLSGPEEGVGAAVSWEGRKSGKGTSTIVESVPDKLVRNRLDFEKPMKGTSIAELALTPENGATLVTWTMYGPNNFMGKVMSLFMNCERMMGEQFDQGLANLDAMVTKSQ